MLERPKTSYYFCHLDGRSPREAGLGGDEFGECCLILLRRPLVGRGSGAVRMFRKAPLREAVAWHIAYRSGS